LSFKVSVLTIPLTIYFQLCIHFPEFLKDEKSIEQTCNATKGLFKNSCSKIVVLCIRGYTIQVGSEYIYGISRPQSQHPDGNVQLLYSCTRKVNACTYAFGTLLSSHKARRIGHSLKLMFRQ